MPWQNLTAWTMFSSQNREKFWEIWVWPGSVVAYPRGRHDIPYEWPKGLFSPRVSQRKSCSPHLHPRDPGSAHVPCHLASLRYFRNWGPSRLLTLTDHLPLARQVLLWVLYRLSDVCTWEQVKWYRKIHNEDFCPLHHPSPGPAFEKCFLCLLLLLLDSHNLS